MINEENVPVYANFKRRLYEKPTAFLAKQEMVKIIMIRGDKFKIEMTNGETGWIDQRWGRKMERDGELVEMSPLDIFGTLDNPIPIYILNMDDPDFQPIRIERSFLTEEFLENIVRTDFNGEKIIFAK